MAEHLMAVLRFITVGSGEQCVIIPGISMMLMWYVVSLASFVHPGLPGEQRTVRGLVLSGWIESFVEEMRHRYKSVLIIDGEHLAVVIARMQVWSVKEFV